MRFRLVPGNFPALTLGVLTACTMILLSAPRAAAQAISFAQVNAATPQTTTTSAIVPFLSAQTAGDLNVVVVGWNDTASAVASVADTKGNTYVRAVGPTAQAGLGTQSIYYAANIAAAAAGANSVTVTFSVSANHPDVRIAEYRGLAVTNPVDVVATGQGSSGTSSITSAVTTTNANDLLVGANLVGNITTGAGTSFTARLISNPDSDIIEDRIVTATGSYTASAAISAGAWIMQMVAFRAQASSPDLTLTKAHAGTFSQGQTGATYTLTASNGAGAGSTSGTVTVADTLPTGLTATALSGTGWTCTLASISCTRSDVLAGAASYPAITLTVSVSATAPASVTNSATVSGGGDVTTGNNTATDVTTIIPVPANLTLTKTHVGNFTQGQNSAVYTLTASNIAGNGSTNGTVTVADTLPTGLTATALSGTGWTCTLASVSCTRSDVLAAGASYPAITLTVSVSATAPATVTNAATISGGGDVSSANNTASDATTVIPVPADLAIIKTHVGSFTQGQTGAVYTLTASNLAGAGPTNGAVTVTDTVPTGLTAAAIAGTGWTCTLASVSCSRSDVLAAGASYPAITLTVNVSPTAPASVTNTASVAGGGDTTPANNTASDATNITPSGVVTPTFKQFNSTNPQSSPSSVTVTFVSAQTAGDLNVVAVGWNMATGHVQSVTDSKGNAYALAVGPTILAGAATQSMYYAPNIAAAAAGANIVTVTFDQAVAFPDVRIAEYSGIAAVNPVDVVVAATGNAATSNSGAITTTNANDLLVGANIVQTLTTGAGTNFTQRVITSPDGDILEDRVVTAVGSYGATAPVSPAGGWIMQMVAFTAAGSSVPPADLTITKTHAGAFSQGQIGASYALTVSNAAGGGVTSGVVTVIDTLPTGLVATALSGTGWSCTLASLSCTRSDVLAAGASYPAITVTVNVSATAPASITNTANVSGGGDVTAGNNTATDATTVIAVPADLTIIKTHTGNFSQGQTGALYTLTASNLAGNGPTSGTVTVADTLPSSLTATAISGSGWTCTLASVSCSRSDVLAAGASYPAITVTVNVSATAPASVTNTASVSGGGDATSANNAATDVTAVTAVPADLTIIKTHTGNFSQGQTGALYTLTASNVVGSGPTSGTVTVTDTLPTGLTATAISGAGWTCTLASVSCTRSDVLAAGASYPAITLTVNVASNAAASITNTASVSGGGDVTTGDNTASDPTTVVAVPSDLTITKTHTGNFSQGQVGATYTLTVSNAGAGPASGTVTLTDTLPTGLTATAISGFGWTCTLASVSCARSDGLAPSASYSAITLTVTVAGNAPASITNTASVSGGGEVNTANDTASDPTTVGAVSPDLTIIKTHTGNFSQGQVGAAYTLTLSNVGTGPTSGTVTVTDTLPTGLTASAISGTGWTCTLASVSCTRSDVLAAGTSYPAITLTVTVASNAAASITNTANVSGGGDTTPANNTASDATTITVVPADLTIIKTHVGNFSQGQTGAVYTLTASNVAGGGPTSGAVTVTDTLPTGLTASAISGTGWTCTLASVSCTRSDVLAAGSSYPAIALTVNVAATAPTSVTNTANVSGGGDTTPANDTASDATTITVVPADLTIIKTHVGNFSQGQTGAVYTLTASNVAGSGPTSGTVTLTDTLPTGLTASAISGTGWTCTLASVSCTRSDVLAAGTSYPAITLTVTVASNAAASITNTASVSGGGDTTPANDTANDATTVTPVPADLTIIKTHTGNFTQGQTGAAYTLTTSNVAGSGPTSGTVTVTDTLPTGLTATAISGTGWTCTLASVSCTRGDVLAAGASYPAIALTVNVSATAPASVTNTVTVSGGGDNTPANDTATDVTTINAGTSATPTFKQFNSADPQSSPSSLTVTFVSAQTPGDLNVVVVGWNMATGHVQSVTDTKGNAYSLAVGPTVLAGIATQSIYYAPNIAAAAAGANIVTVTFDQAVAFPDIRIAEYGGIATAGPVDVVAAATGSSTTSSSGAVTTTNANDLLVGANVVQTITTGPGTSFTQRVITNPDSDILEDRVVTTAGSYSATAPVSPAGGWIMQMVAFRAASSAQPPTVDLVPTKTHVGSFVQGQVGATYTIGVTNNGTGPTTAAVTLADTLPTGLTATALSGTGWTCTVASVSCTRSDALAAGASFPAITLTVNVSGTAPASVTNVATVSGGGDSNGANNTASDATTITGSSDTQPPSPTGPLTATAVSGVEIDLSWGAATDNVGVTGYRVERCQGVGCSVFTKLGTNVTTTTFADTSLSPNTSYSYIVRAQDAAGNLGDYSNVGTATTLATNPTLIAAYAFSEGAGTTVADVSGHLNVGTIANATWTSSGKFGSALVFNGTNALVTIADNPALRMTTAMTLEAWVNPSVLTSTWRDVIYKGNDNYYLEGTTTSAGVPAGGATINGTGLEAYDPAPLPLNTWSHLAETFDGTTIRLYVNGSQVAAATRAGTIATSTNPLQIGGDSIYGQFWQGMIDDVRIYNVTLTPAQIQTDMATPVDGGGSLPVLNLSTPSLTFGSQNTGTTSSPQTVTLNNVGGAPLNVSSILIGGANAGDFAQTNTCGAPVPAGSGCAIQVTFTPTAANARSATITIANNAPGAPHTVSLAGTGVGFAVTPQTAVVVAGQTQQFTPSGGSGAVVWSVDGVIGGAAATGTITTGGLYTAPPTAGPHTVTGAQTTPPASASSAVLVTGHPGVFTHHNDQARTGQNQSETVLTPANVNSATFGKLATYATDGIAHASPLYVANVNIPGVGIRNVVYVATEHDSVYAFDASGASASPFWHVSFINPAAGITTVPNGDTGECCDITPEIGITGTPVIDPATQTLYVVVKTKEGPSTYVHRLHALNIATGAEKLGGPVLIQASVPGTGAGSSAGTLPFDQLRENQRTALLLLNGVVYFGFGSHGDYQPYHGWILGYDATTLHQTMVYCSTPNGEGGGIWLSGGGLTVDTDGSLFFATGDGTFDASTGGKDYGDSFVRLSTTGTVLDYFTPSNEGTLNSNNLDLDAGGMIVLPDQGGTHPHMIGSAGKSGSVFLVDRDNMTHFHATDQNPQTLLNVFPFGQPLPGNYSSPVYFNGSMYFGPVADVVQAFRFTNGVLSTAPTSTSPEAYPYPGAALAISANGTANAILWAVQKNGAASGTLRAYDPANLAVEFYNSNQAGTRDTLAVAAKFAIPLVVNGRVFVATEATLTVFGLIP